MKPKLILCLALVLSGGLFGCSSAPKIHSTTSMTTYDGETFTAPRKLQNGSASLPEVYAWANSMLGTNSGSVLGTNYYPLETIHADIFQNGGDDLFVAEPAWDGTGGNLYLAFVQSRSGYRFVAIFGLADLKSFRQTAKAVLVLSPFHIKAVAPAESHFVIWIVTAFTKSWNAFCRAAMVLMPRAKTGFWIALWIMNRTTQRK